MANKKRHSRDIDNFGFWDPPPPNMTDAEWVKWQRKQQENANKAINIIFWFVSVPMIIFGIIIALI